MFDKKLQAHALRRRGKSVGDIAFKLGVSKSTASLWCREIELTSTQQERLRANAIAAGHRGRLIGTQKNRQKRLDAIQLSKDLGKREIGKLTKRDLTILAAALFWAEGAKTGSRFMFVNSDPSMVLCMYKYLSEVEKIEPNRLSMTVQINRIHEKRIHKVFRFWSSLLEIPLRQFGKPYYIDVTPKKVYANYDSYYGIARLRVRGGASLQYKLLGYIDALQNNSRLPR